MKKEDLLALWKGINWEKHDSGIYFLGQCCNKAVNIHFTGYCEQDLLLLSDEWRVHLKSSRLWLIKQTENK